MDLLFILIFFEEDRAHKKRIKEPGRKIYILSTLSGINERENAHDRLQMFINGH